MEYALKYSKTLIALSKKTSAFTNELEANRLVSLLTPIFLAAWTISFKYTMQNFFCKNIQKITIKIQKITINEARVFYCMMRELREKLVYPVCVYWESN